MLGVGIRCVFLQFVLQQATRETFMIYDATKSTYLFWGKKSPKGHGLAHTIIKREINVSEKMLENC